MQDLGRDPTKRNPDGMESEDFRHEQREKRPLMRRQKGWKGFVWGYAERYKVFDKIWHQIKWGKDGKLSGAESIEKDGNKTVYTYK
jgi:hypothetical protein